MFRSQLLFVAFARKILGLKDAHSTEINPETPHPVVDLLPEQRKMRFKGGTMRLGSHSVKIIPHTKLYNAYGQELIFERFRHRYHINTAYVEKAKEKGLVVSATDPTGRIVNAIELAGQKWIIGVQFHPEFKSRPYRPSPIYYEFIRQIKTRKYS